MRAISWLAGDLLASQEGLSSLQLDRSFVSYLVTVYTIYS